MLFSDRPRVIYKKNPLNQVICQVRFPTVLAIEANVPSGFQEAIRDEFPLYDVAPSGGLPKGLPSEIARLLSVDAAAGKEHNFVSDDSFWKVTLTKDFLALTAGRYERWEQFEKKLKGPFEALLNEYEPSFFSRVGLRYQNVISRENVGLADTPWSTLLAQFLAGELSVSEIEPNIVGRVGEFLLNLGDKEGKVRVKHGFVQAENRNEQLYLIDADYFIDDRKVERDETLKKLTDLHGYARKLFRECIQDKLHEAMEPSAID